MERVEGEISRLRQAVLDTPVVLPDNKTDRVSWPIGVPPANKPANRFDLLRWDYFTMKHIYLKSDFNNIEELSGADLLDIQVGNMMQCGSEHTLGTTTSH